MKTLNVGVIGTEDMYKTHTTSFMKNQTCKVIAAFSSEMNTCRGFL